MSTARKAGLLVVFLSLAVPGVSQAQPAPDPVQCPPPMLTPTAIPGVRDPRIRMHRAPALLNTEIQGLENLASTTPKNSPDLVQLHRRLAEDYFELSEGALAEKARAVAAGDHALAISRAETAAEARVHGKEAYTKILAEAPGYAQLDQVQYYLALAYERDHDLGNARRMYFTLIQQRPDSSYVPLAYLAFGDMFFDEARGDPSKWELAAQAYQKVISYPPPLNKAFGYAWYRLAHVKWNQGDGTAARQAFAKVSEYATAYAGQAGGTTELRAAASLDSAALRQVCPAVGP
jgi:TolA-binding protein